MGRVRGPVLRPYVVYYSRLLLQYVPWECIPARVACRNAAFLYTTRAHTLLYAPHSSRRSSSTNPRVSGRILAASPFTVLGTDWWRSHAPLLSSVPLPDTPRVEQLVAAAPVRVPLCVGGRGTTGGRHQ